jgi:glycosyltransferase involved in cell wall biosynthesis
MFEVAVAVAGSRVPAWHARCVDALRAKHELLRVRVVEVDAPAWTPPQGAAARLAGETLAPAELRIDSHSLHGADLILNLTPGAPAALAPHGVWSFRLERSDEASLPFAREIGAGAATLEIALLRRIGNDSAALRSGRFAVAPRYSTTLRNAFPIVAEWPATFAAAAASGLALPAVPDGVQTQRRVLGLLEGVRFAAWTFVRRFYVEGWDVGLCAGSPQRLLDGEPLDVRWIGPARRAGFDADPFLVEREGRRALFVEAYDYARKRGVIDAALLDADGRVARRARVIDAPGHLSYPYPLEVDGELFLIPENHASGEVPLYRCTEFPWRWEREAPLLRIDGVDTTLFEHEGRWWACCTRYSQGSTLALFAFHAPSFRGPWTPHALNPVVVDVGSARPAGRPFTLEGVLYRPAQDCSRTYGGGLVLARVDELTPAAYRETIVRRLEGGALRPPRQGIHTLGFAPGTIVLDGKRVTFDALNPVRRLVQLARRRAARIGRPPAPANGGRRPLRIVHVCAQLGFYGAENVVTRLVQHSHEPDTTLVAMTVNRWAHPEVRAALDFPIVEIDRGGRGDLFFLWRMVRELRRIRPDVVHTHAHHGRYWGRLAAVLAGVPVIVHTEHNSELKPPAPRALFAALNRALEPRTTAFATFNALRRDALAAAERIGNERIAVIPNGIPIVETPAGAREHARAELLLGAGELSILMLSRLFPEKRLDLALDAFAALPAPLRARAKLVLFGDGPLHAELAARALRLGIAERVRFPGFRSDASALLAGGDVLLLTSDREAQPLALIDAMVARVPIVSVPWKGAAALLHDGRFGRIAASYEPADVAAALRDVLEDRAAAEARAEDAYAHACVEYDIRTQTQRYAALYRRLSRTTRSASSRIAAPRS